ncbi:HlyD family secretion protein [Rhizobium bangladeshense]|uniref:HlyD family secretion protein n=1 Tax=Rhizobium bangladeshense TaxID=1138189 RepID=UPI0007E53D1D|nr:HlyD family secretion protein [Rhizobium bangladeshense]
MDGQLNPVSMRVPSRPEDDEGARAKRSAASEASPVTAGGFRRLAVPIVAVAAVSAAVAWAMMDWNSWTAGADRQTTDDAVISADVSTLSAQISGMIKSTPVSDYQRVTKGQVLAEIDPREYDAAVEAASANLASAQASLSNLANQIELQMAVVRAAEAQNASALAQQTQTEQEFQRQKQLGEATSQHELQQAQAAYLQAEAAVNSTAAAIEQQKAQLKVLQGQEPLLQAEVRAAQANLDTAQVRQSYTRILAPFDGVLGRKLVHEGDVVGAGAGIVAEIPLPNVYVTANFKETQLARMKPGQRADITVDTFPGQVLHGKVADLSPASGAVFALLPPDNATGNYTKVVQRIPVRIDFDADQPLIGQMRPGMSVIVTIDTPAGGDR